jgi:2-polyprenyl-3-methyl-5-hydroxy-6-metoxy-1,4-benzoquinol methylase
MKPLVSPEYAEMNRKLHEEHDDYGILGGQCAGQVIAVAKNNGLRLILDFGCGKGTLKPALKKLAPSLKVIEYDPAIKNKDRLPSVSPDLIVALDVMEHIEPECLESVLETMRNLKPKGVYLLIALEPANKTLPDGRNAHLIVQQASWWRDQLDKYFRTEHAEEHPSHLVFLGSPKR